MLTAGFIPMKLSTRLLHEARQSQFPILLSIGLGLLAGILGIIQAREVSTLIGQVFLQGKSLPSISGIVFALIIIVILRAGFVLGGDLCASGAARRIKASLRQRLYWHIIEIGPAFLRSEAGERNVQTGELVNVIIEGVEAIEVYFSQYLPQIALAALVPLSILIFVFPSDQLSGIILLVTAPLLPLFMFLIGSVAKNYTRKQWRGLSRMSAYFLDVLQGLITLKSLGRSREQAGIINKVSEHYRQSTMDVLKVTFLSALVLELIATLSTAVVAVEIGIRLLYGRLAFEQAFFVLLLAPEFYLPLRQLGARFHAGMSGVEAARRIFELLDLPTSPKIQTINSPDHSAEKYSSPPAILIKDISYTYSNQRRVLQDVTFEIPAGKITALEGESGAGKTTLTWLLLRFLQLQSGEITVKGTRLSEIPVEQWLEKVTWVPQNPYLFNDTVAANINLVKPNASDEELQRAAHLAHADEFIHQLPQGYDTVIGERGLRLSAGQAQRVVLARAFLKNAPFLILDEATSHLDPEMDALLQESMERLCLGRTVLVIAHRRSTLARADRVVKLSHGRVEQIEENQKSAAPPQGSLSSPLSLANTQLQPKNPHPMREFRNEPEQEKSLDASTIRLLKLLSPFSGRILLSIFLGFATIASSIGLMATAAYIISAAALHPSIAELQVAIVGVRFFGLSRGVFRYLERLVSHDVTFRLLARWRVWFYQALEPLAPARLLQYHSGDLLSRVMGDISALESFYVRSIAPPLVALLITIATGAFMGAYGVDLAWVLIGFMLLAGFFLPLLTYNLSHHLGPRLVQARADLTTTVIDGIQGLADLLAYGQAKAQLERLNQVGNRLIILQARMGRLTALQTAISGLIANLGMLSILVLAIQNVSHGQLAGVLLGVMALATLMSFEAMQTLPLAAVNLETSQAAARRLYELVDTRPAVVDPVKPLTLPPKAQLDVQDLSFQYPAWVDEPQSATEVGFGLKNISFSLSPAKHIAIVGPSGAGKTTLINLLQRYWEYQQGSILWGGHELRLYHQQDIHKHVGVMSQNTYLFSATIKENLLIARPEASQEEIIRATQAAQLHEMVQSLPDGYNTWIGEHGLQLSAGERQRLAIARLFLKDAPLLILDEPTANLDAKTELAVLNSIQQLSQGRTTISITQHMTGLGTMDEILVLQDGHLIEKGSHAELLSTYGLYHRMWILYNQVI